jgi:hypothetical protein
MALPGEPLRQAPGPVQCGRRAAQRRARRRPVREAELARLRAAGSIRESHRTEVTKLSRRPKTTARRRQSGHSSNRSRIASSLAAQADEPLRFGLVVSIRHNKMVIAAGRRSSTAARHPAQDGEIRKVAAAIHGDRSSGERLPGRRAHRRSTLRAGSSATTGVHVDALARCDVPGRQGASCSPSLSAAGFRRDGSRRGQHHQGLEAEELALRAYRDAWMSTDADLQALTAAKSASLSVWGGPPCPHGIPRHAFSDLAH